MRSALVLIASKEMPAARAGARNSHPGVWRPTWASRLRETKHVEEILAASLLAATAVTGVLPAPTPLKSGS